MSTSDSAAALQAQSENNGSPRLRRRYIILAQLALLVVATVIALLLAEGALRIAKVEPLLPRYGDPVLGFGEQPNMVATFDFPEYGGVLTMRTNNLGFHEDTDTLAVKPGGYRRVVFVGDSQTAGECPNPENYPNVLEGLVNQRPGTAPYEILNAGTGRYSPYQYYVKSKERVLPLKPDHLVVAIYAGNDFMDLTRQDDRPYLTLEAGGAIRHHAPHFVVFDDPASPPGWLGGSRVYALTRRTLGPTVSYQMTRAKMLWMNVRETGAGPFDVARYMIRVKQLTGISLGVMTQSLLQQEWFRHFPDAYDRANGFNRYVMGQFKAMCDQNGIRLTYVVLPTKVRVEPEDIKPLLARLEQYDPALKWKTMAALEDRIAGDVVKAGSELGVEVVDLTKPMIERKANKRRYYPEDMHLNPAGNELVASILSESVFDRH